MAVSKSKPPAEDNSDSWNELDDTTGSRRKSDSVILPMIQGLRVLVIGHSVRRREKLVKVLREHNVKAAATTADENGYRAALKFSPDVAIAEMARPGDPGWWVFKRFHRHPVLRWMPALLMKWWEEKDRVESVQVNQVFERLVEALTPIRILEERIAAGRKLGDRVEITGIQPVLKVLVDARLNGTLSVNDSWSVFDLEMDKGQITSCVRRGVDGREDAGPDGFLQLLTVDNGNWTFRIHDSAPRPRDIKADFNGLMEASNKKLVGFFGPATDEKSPGFKRRLKVERPICHDVAATLSGLGRDVMEAIAAGASEKELDTILEGQEDRVPIERAMVNLLRCGGVYYLDDKNRRQEDEEAKLASGVAHVLSWISMDHRMIQESPLDGGARGKHPQPQTGLYSFSTAAEGKAEGGVDKLKPAPLDPNMTVDLSEDDSWRPSEMFEQEQQSDDPAWRRHYDDDNGGARHSFLGVVPHESLAPGPDMEGRSKFQMWLAVAIAIIMTGLILGGLVLVAGGDDDRRGRDSQRDF